jgi:hypothetical protein
MNFHARKRDRGGTRSVVSAHVSGRATGRTGDSVRWDPASSRAATGGTMPRIGAVLLAVIVVALLTIGLHVLFQ